MFFFSKCSLQIVKDFTCPNISVFVTEMTVEAKEELVRMYSFKTKLLLLISLLD